MQHAMSSMRTYSSSSWDWFKATIFVSLDKASAILFLEDTANVIIVVEDTKPKRSIRADGLDFFE